MKVSELHGAQLDLWTAKAQGWKIGNPFGTMTDAYLNETGNIIMYEEEYSPSTNWRQLGELIEKYDIEFFRLNGACKARIHHEDGVNLYLSSGNTPHKAICRAIVLSVYGGEVLDE